MSQGHLSPALSPKGGEGVIRSTPGAREAKTLTQLFDAAQNGMRRVIALGLFAHEIKSQLKHGQFGQWLAEHAPELSRQVEGRSLASKALSSYMQLTAGVLEAVGYKLGDYLGIAKITAGDLSHGGEILLTDMRLPEAADEFREKVCAIVDGKTQRQLFAEFKTADDEGAVAKAGGAKPIKFHCQKCALGGAGVPPVVTPLRGIFGRVVTCPKCGTKQKAKPDPPTAAEELKARQEHAQDLLESWRRPLRVFLDEEQDAGLELKAGDWRAALEDLLSGTALARARLKAGNAGGKRGKGEKGKRGLL